MMPPDWIAEMRECIKELGAERALGYVELLAEFGPDAEFRAPKMGDILVRPLTKDFIRKLHANVFAQEEAEFVGSRESREALRKGQEARLELALSGKRGPKQRLRPWDVVEVAAEIAMADAEERAGKKRKPTVVLSVDVKRALRRRERLCDKLTEALQKRNKKNDKPLDRMTMHRMLKSYTHDQWYNLVAFRILVKYEGA